MAVDDVNFLFEQFLPFQWKGVIVPTSKFTTSLRHDLVSHKYPGKDGANVEWTGRAPLHFTASIPFLNGAVPGKGESWTALYPTQYRNFLTVASRGESGVLQHPEFGAINCKLEACETTWSAERRDGVIVECSWIETIDTGDAGDFVNANPSPVTMLLGAAKDLDAQLGTVKPPFPTLPVYSPDFAATMRGITALSDQVHLFSARGLGKLGAIQYRLNTLQSSIGRVLTINPATTVKNIISPNSNGRSRAALLWPMNNAIEQLRAATNDAKQVLGTNGKPVKVYVTPIDMTLAAVAQNVRAPIADVIALNPEACAHPIVEARTRVRYYAAA